MSDDRLRARAALAEVAAVREAITTGIDIGIAIDQGDAEILVKHILRRWSLVMAAGYPEGGAA